MKFYCHRCRLVFSFLCLFLCLKSGFCDSAVQPYRPQRICLTLTAEPSKSQAVSWQTLGNDTTAIAQLRKTADHPAQNNKPGTIESKPGVTIVVGKDRFCHHTVVFNDLDAGTWYDYRLGNKSAWIKWHRFRTASKKNKPFTLLYFGDIQNKIESMCAPVFQKALQTVPDAGFWMFAGDLVNDGADDSQWQSFFTAMGGVPNRIPLAPTAGNHEYPDPRVTSPEDHRITKLWQPHFNLPKNGPAGLKDTCYYFLYHTTLFIVLNGNEKLDIQARWMNRLLERSKHTWAVISIHQPMYSTSKRRNDTRYQNIFIPVFDRHGVDLVLQGHDHAYARTFALKNHRKTEKNEKGTIYLMTITGPKSYPVSPRYAHLFAKAITGRQCFQSILIDSKSIRVNSFDSSGTVFDSFTIHH